MRNRRESETGLGFGIKFLLFAAMLIDACRLAIEFEYNKFQARQQIPLLLQNWAIF